MSDFPEAIGTASEGGLFARAISRRQGGAKLDETGHFEEGACLNCGTELVGDYCHTCGQKAHLHRTLSAVGHDLVHGVLHLDGKLWKTLPMLAWRPGELTRKYVDGQRADFVSPMAMFLFSVFLMFAVFQALGITAPTDLGSPLAKSEAQALEAKAGFESRLATLEPDQAGERAELEEKIAGIDTAIEAIRKGEDFSYENATGGRTYQSVRLTGIDSIDNGLVKKWRKHPELMLYKLQANSYKFSWLLIPLSLPFVWILFAWKRRFKAYDHAIFVTYSLAFMSLMFITLSLLGTIGFPMPLLATAAVIVPPVHIYRQLRRTYELSRFGALWRTWILLWFVLFILTIFLQILLLLGAF